MSLVVDGVTRLKGGTPQCLGTVLRQHHVQGTRCARVFPRPGGWGGRSTLAAAAGSHPAAAARPSGPAPARIGTGWISEVLLEMVTPPGMRAATCTSQASTDRPPPAAAPRVEASVAGRMAAEARGTPRVSLSVGHSTCGGGGSAAGGGSSVYVVEGFRHTYDIRGHDRLPPHRSSFTKGPSWTRLAWVRLWGGVRGRATASVSGRMAVGAQGKPECLPRSPPPPAGTSAPLAAPVST